MKLSCDYTNQDNSRETLVILKNPLWDEIEALYHEEEAQLPDTPDKQVVSGLFRFLALQAEQEVYLWYARRQGHCFVWENVLNRTDDLYADENSVSGIVRKEKRRLEIIDVSVDRELWGWLETYHFEL